MNFAQNHRTEARAHTLRRLLVSTAFLALWSKGLPEIVTAQTPAQAQAAVTGGTVQGVLLADGGASFKAIPYGAAPIGDLRWRDVQPVKPWSGVRYAAEYGADCPQTTGPNGPALNGVPERKTSEDCLFVNVWTPQWPASTKLPVMVWLHGSELSGGTGALPAGPVEGAETSLMRHGVVVVSINYRPHLLGLMAHPALTAESPHHASGNYTILDAVAALRWVHANIAHFGGDPSRVTILGPTGGAVLVSYLVTSPLTKGLIHRAIIESGAPTQGGRPTLSEQQLEHIGLSVAEVLHAPADNPIAYLRSLPASDIVTAAKEIAAKRDLYGGYGEGMDGYAIPQSPPEVFRSHNEAHIPLLLGSAAQDSSQVDGITALKSKPTPEELHAWLENAVHVFYARYPDLVQQAARIYGLQGEPNAVSTYPPDGSVQLQLGVDLHHRCPVITTAQWHSAIASTYVYEFSRATPSHPPVHEAELRFVLGTLSDDEVSNESARQYANTMQTYWTNFAKTGDPNGPGLPPWPRYEMSHKAALDFTADEPVAREQYRAAACEPYVDMMNRLPKPLLVK